MRCSGAGIQKAPLCLVLDSGGVRKKQFFRRTCLYRLLGFPLSLILPSLGCGLLRQRNCNGGAKSSILTFGSLV